jgi:predicted nuclease of restriction endonuclease-like (RecB) superfamily
MQRAKDSATRDFYIRETLAHGWSRAILEIQIQNQLHLRVGKAQNNFALTMPPADSDMAAQLFKDPYLFDFLGTADPRREAEVEQTLVDHIQKSAGRTTPSTSSSTTSSSADMSSSS